MFMSISQVASLYWQRTWRERECVWLSIAGFYVQSARYSNIMLLKLAVEYIESLILNLIELLCDVRLNYTSDYIIVSIFVSGTFFSQ